MHLAILAKILPVGIDHCGRVVIDPFRPLFKQGHNDDNAEFLRE